MSKERNFHVKYKTRNGKIETGAFSAGSKQELYSRLSQNHLIALEISENILSRLNITALFPQIDVPQKTLRDFFFQLGTYLTSGISLEKVMKLSIAHQKNKRLEKILSDIYAKIRAGNSFSECLKEYPSVFPNYISSSVYAGEESGQLGKVLLDISELIDRRMALKNSFSSALIYPFMLLLTAIASILLIIFFAVPKFALIFNDMGKEMPFVMSLMFKISTNQWITLGVLLMLIILTGAAVLYITRNKSLKQRIEKSLITTPRIGELIIHFQLSLYFRILSIAIKSSISVDKAIELANSTLSNSYIAQLFNSILKSIKKGGNFSSSFKDIQWIPEIIPALIEVGEESGKLDDTTGKISEMLGENLQKQVKLLIALAEPLLIIIVGIIIGGIVITLLYSLFSINF